MFLLNAVASLLPASTTEIRSSVIRRRMPRKSADQGHAPLRDLRRSNLGVAQHSNRTRIRFPALNHWDPQTGNPWQESWDRIEFIEFDP